MHKCNPCSVITQILFALRFVNSLTSYGLFLKTRTNNVQHWFLVYKWNSFNVITHFLLTCRFVSSLTYYGLFLTSGTMSGNMYLNFFLNSVVEIPSVILYSLTINRYMYILLLFPASLDCKKMLLVLTCNTLYSCHKIWENLVKRATV